MSRPTDVRFALQRPLGRRALLRGVLAASTAGIGAYAFGCGGKRRAAPALLPITPGLLTQEFVIGQDSRFTLGVLDRIGKPMKDAAVHVRFVTIQDDGVTGSLRGEVDMHPVELKGAGVEAPTGSAGAGAGVPFYLTRAPFDVARTWGAEVIVAPKDGTEPSSTRLLFEVLPGTLSPAIGSAPPASRNETAATAADGGRLCSRDPACPLHDQVIADILGKGRPLVVQFSTPRHCAGPFCGPVLEALLNRHAAYRDRVDFVHIEVWRDFASRTYRETVTEWKVPSEPYTFFIGRDGKVLSRLEAVFADEELDASLEQLVAP